MWSFWLGLGVSSVAYGLRGERIPGKIITIFGSASDSGLRVSERICLVAMGIGASVVGVLDLRTRYLTAYHPIFPKQFLAWARFILI